MRKKDDGFRDFIVGDQLGELDVDCRAMFGGYGLYYRDHFFGIISQSRLYFKTDSASRRKYIEAGCGPFQPNPSQTLKNYFEVPPDVIEETARLTEWALEAARI